MPLPATLVWTPHPFLIQFGENAGLRWYGLAYVAGFFIALWFFRRWEKEGWLPLRGAQIESFFLWVGVAGTCLGGRIFYCLVYNFDEIRHQPWKVFAVWEGGMASHGGILGLALAALLFARHHRVSPWRLWDALACAAPAGIFLGRIANFLNAELWGRPGNVPWAVIFPYSGTPDPRHPSQLYAALLEGALLGAVLLGLRRPLARRPGACAVLFVVLYAVVRFTGEFFREADNGIYFALGWSKGQWLSVATLLFGLVLIPFLPRPATRPS